MNYGLFPPGSFCVSTLFLGQERSREPFQDRWPHDVPICTMELNAQLAGERSGARELLTAWSSSDGMHPRPGEVLVTTELCQRWKRPNSDHRAGVNISAAEMREADSIATQSAVTSWEKCVWPAAGRQNTAKQEVSFALLLRIPSINADF